MRENEIAKLVDFADRRQRDMCTVDRRWAHRALGALARQHEAEQAPPRLGSDELCRQVAGWFMRTIGKQEVADRIVSKDVWPLTRASSEITGTSGGFLVPSLMAAAIIELRALAGVARRESMVWTMGSDELSVPRRTGGFAASFVGETSALTESNLTFDSGSFDCEEGGNIRQNVQRAE